MKELFLGALLAREELDVVDQQSVERAVRTLELRNFVVLKENADNVFGSGFLAFYQLQIVQSNGGLCC